MVTKDWIEGSFPGWCHGGFHRGHAISTRSGSKMERNNFATGGIDSLPIGGRARPLNALGPGVDITAINRPNNR
jgi:hypothetical protein